MLTEKNMGQLIISKNKFLFRLLDLSILVISFLVAFEQFQNSVSITANVFALTAIYASLAFILVRLSKKVVASTLNSKSDILKMACGNAFGLFSAIIIFSVLAYFIPSINEILPLAIISSLASFFIMGTVVPATKRFIEVKAKQDSFKATL